MRPRHRPAGRWRGDSRRLPRGRPFPGGGNRRRPSAVRTLDADQHGLRLVAVLVEGEGVRQSAHDVEGVPGGAEHGIGLVGVQGSGELPQAGIRSRPAAEALRDPRAAAPA
ncbi:hypothetical protein [Streptomyces sp. NPDC000351]|uniref:hypothetical protein n=1 Tax=Streptomyces sp. NPDC000351 TaxID=3154250 RepID=UPI0033237839